MWLTVWLILTMILIMVEIISLGLTSIWFAGGAFVAGLISLTGAHWHSVRDFIFHVFDGKYEPEVLTAYITDFIKTDNKDKFLQGYDYLSGDIILEKYNKYAKSSNTVVEKSVLDKIKNETRAKSTGKKCDKSAEDWSPLYF